MLYPDPPSINISSVTTNPTLSSQNFQGYVCIALSPATSFPSCTVIPINPTLLFS